jgi:hypothetical protein
MQISRISSKHRHSPSLERREEADIAIEIVYFGDMRSPISCFGEQVDCCGIGRKTGGQRWNTFYSLAIKSELFRILGGKNIVCFWRDLDYASNGNIVL